MTNPPGPGPEPYPQQPYQGYGPPPGPPPGQFPPSYGGYEPQLPPKKSKTGLWVAVGVVVVLVVALGVTGFVAPGFFLSKNNAASGADSTARQIVDAMNAKNTAALNKLRCQDADPAVADMISSLDVLTSAKLVGAAQKVSDAEYTVTIGVTVSGATNTGHVTGTLANEAGGWCVKNVVGSQDQQAPASVPSTSNVAPSTAAVSIPTARTPVPRRPAPLPNPASCHYPADTKTAAAKQAIAPPDALLPSTGTVPVTLRTSAGDIPLTLDRALAPCTVNSFLSLAQQSFYTGTSCHRLGTSGLQMLQCGDPAGDGTGGPGYTYADEVFPQLTYGRGILAMANAGPDTNGSQFFLVYGDAPLPPAYTVFGSISDPGLQVLDKVARGGIDPTSAASSQDGTGKPAIPVKFTGVTVGG